jgi:tRNA(Arg) A34 adenosine deaminase TadA
MNEQKEIDLQYLKLAIEQSQKSFETGRFPAGAVVTENGEVVWTTIQVMHRCFGQLWL